MAITVDPLFKRNAAAEARAIKSGNVTKEQIDARGGINASGYYGDSWSADKNLTDAEYAAASAKGGGTAVNAATAAKSGNAVVTPGGGGAQLVAADGTVFTDQAAFVKYQADLRAAGLAKDAIAAEDLSKRQSAYDLLYNEFSQYGLGDLVTPLKSYIQSGINPAEFTLRLRETPAYQQRFKANADRVKNGLAALNEAQYIGLEDQYQNIMRNYGLPASYYTKGQYGTQEGFQKFIANDVSAVELEDRIATAQQRVLNSNPEVLQALKQFYPDISNADVLAYALDPQNALTNIKRKVTAAEIGGAALAQGLQAQGGTAESLAGLGITKAQAQQGYADVAQMVPVGSQLADIYKQTPYTQQTAEAEVFNTAGAAEAATKRKKLSALEQASFSGSSGVGSLGRDKGIYGAAFGQQGQY